VSERERRREGANERTLKERWWATERLTGRKRERERERETGRARESKKA